MWSPIWVRKSLFHRGLEFNYKTVGFAFLIGFCSLLIDPFAYNSISAPKNLLFSVGAPFFLLLALLRAKAIHIGIIPFLYFLRIVWLAIGNPEWVIHPSNDGFYLSVGILCWMIFVVQLKSNFDKKLFLKVLFWIGIIEVFIGIWQIISYVPDPLYPIKTPFMGTFGTPNGLGIFLVLSLLSGIYLIYSNQRNYVYWLGSIVLFTGIFLSESRGSILALLSTFTFTLVITSYHKKKLSYRKWIVVSGISMIAIASLFLYRIDVESTSGRWMIWEITGLMIQDKPLFGVGQGNYAVEYLNYQATYFEDSTHSENEIKAANIKQAHNEFLQSFAEGGIVNSMLLLLIWVIPFYQASKRLAKNFDYLMLVQLGIHTAIFVHALIDSPLHVLPVAIVGYTNLVLLSSDKFNIKKKSLVRLFFLVLTSSYLILSAFKQIAKYPGFHHWKKGVEHSVNMEWKAAILDLSKAIEYLPEKGELLFNLGTANIFNNQYSKGLYFTNESKKYFNDKNIYLSESYAYLQLGEYKKAEEKALIALSMFPTHLAPHLLLGEIYFYLGDKEKSKASLQKCMEEDIPITSPETKQISEDATLIYQRFYGH